MDEMKIKLHTKFMNDLISKLITKAIKNNSGHDIDVKLEGLNAEFLGGETTINTNITIKLDSKEFKEIMKLLS